MKKTIFTLLAVSVLSLSVSSAAFASNTLTAGQSLAKGQGLYSNDGRFAFLMQTDENLVLYNAGTSLWSSSTNGMKAYYYDSFLGRETIRHPEKVMLYTNGALKVTDLPGQSVFWQADTQSWIANNYRIPMIFPTYGDKLIMQDDGNVVLYDTHSNSNWMPVWATNTGGR
ncbi:hypothetical protein [Tumebacillus permanentifrigoris]|uniref:Bulb-type lectin domain-containing protein n=1 Tax=Tumebacillus permanentifrigoris TaxID=378543 RepID=A0A316D5M9_9BACL|nr:hypothetical protein [Tumebacillus permanentifrigoris]PWK07022.1 hypothetical protein C7459_11894 [Tumebacillus permanentifrigoris]